jgi:hypothetical protein
VETADEENGGANPLDNITDPSPSLDLAASYHGLASPAEKEKKGREKRLAFPSAAGRAWAADDVVKNSQDVTGHTGPGGFPPPGNLIRLRRPCPGIDED